MDGLSLNKKAPQPSTLLLGTGSCHADHIIGSVKIRSFGPINGVPGRSRQGANTKKRSERAIIHRLPLKEKLRAGYGDSSIGFLLNYWKIVIE
jgi:hypothetical protein